MQEIVAESINDLDFLKLQLTTEIESIEIIIESLKIYESVQTYITETDSNKKKDLVNTFIEVQQYIESIKTLQEYKENLRKLNNLTSIDGKIYAKESEDKTEYSPKKALKHLVELKVDNGLTEKPTVDELNEYIDNVRKTLRDSERVYDDEIKDEVLSYPVLKNPNNYDIKNAGTMPKLTEKDFLEEEDLTQREEEAFFGREVREALNIPHKNDNIKSIGAKKNV